MDRNTLARKLLKTLTNSTTYIEIKGINNRKTKYDIDDVLVREGQICLTTKKRGR